LVHDGHVIVTQLPAPDRVEVAPLNDPRERVSRGNHWIDGLNVVVEQIEAVGDIGHLGEIRVYPPENEAVLLVYFHHGCVRAYVLVNW